MVRRVAFTILCLALAGTAFGSADPQPDVNLFGVLFLFIAFILWFYWGDIEAGYSYLDDRGVPGYERTRLMCIRLAPMRLRESPGRERKA